MGADRADVREDADLAARLGVAYLEGLRGGPSVGPDSVAAMAKHFPGGGPQRDGEDPHFPHGKEQDYPGGMFDYHLRPFRAAIAAGVTQIMPSYGVPVGTKYDEVAFGFNNGVINGLLRTELGFDGIVCSDWGIVTDHADHGRTARGQGLGSRVPQPFATDADGPQRRGGPVRRGVPDRSWSRTWCASGALPASRLDRSVRRLLTEKFRLGLFDHRRYVDPDAADRTAGRADFRAAGRRAQSASVTVLTNRDRCLPASGGARLFAEGVDPAIAASYGEVVTDPAQADLAVLRLSTPYEQRSGRFESFFHAGPLDFKPAGWRRSCGCWPPCPPWWPSTSSGPAVIPEISAAAGAVLAVFGASDAALLNVVFGRAEPRAGCRSSCRGAWTRCAWGGRMCPGSRPTRCSTTGTGSAWIRHDSGEHGRLADVGALGRGEQRQRSFPASSRRCASASARSGSRSSCR